jgi:hypothetical protein
LLSHADHDLIIGLRHPIGASSNVGWRLLSFSRYANLNFFWCHPIVDLEPAQIGCFVGRPDGAVQGGAVIDGSELSGFLRVGNVSVIVRDPDFVSGALSAEIRADVKLPRCPIAAAAIVTKKPGAGIQLGQAGVLAKYRFTGTDGALIAGWRTPNEIVAQLKAPTDWVDGADVRLSLALRGSKYVGAGLAVTVNA